MQSGLVRSYVTKITPVKKTRTKTVKIYRPEKAEQVEKKDTLPYVIRRTAFAKWLPIYREIKHNGTQISTIVRRLDGDLKKLAKDLERVAPADRITVREELKQIRLKGDYVHDIRHFFTVRGF
ncbi:hypothetical protein HDU96_004769 [Phlyctochytrium bullatum]|nr:hypothetical protein HDU96_004769 [Phlyctochytrium bullatum]